MRTFPKDTTVNKLHEAPAFKAAMPSTAEAMKMSEASIPALLAVILALFMPYIAGVGLHAFGLFKSISVEGLGHFEAALAFLLIVAMTIRGAVLHGILSFLALSAELQRSLAIKAEAERKAKALADRAFRDDMNAILTGSSKS